MGSGIGFCNKICLLEKFFPIKRNKVLHRNGDVEKIFEIVSCYPLFFLDSNFPGKFARDLRITGYIEILC